MITINFILKIITVGLSLSAYAEPVQIYSYDPQGSVEVQSKLTHIRFEDVGIAPGFYKKFSKWKDLAQVHRAFELIKNHMALEHNGEKRRFNWLEPDDRLCFSRAGLSAGLLKLYGFPLVTSVYLGNGFTSCSAWRDGSGNREQKGASCINWPWHNAPGVRVDDQVYILDPALNYSAPLKLEEWVEINYSSGQTLSLAVGMEGFGVHPAFGPYYGYDTQPQDELFNDFLAGYTRDPWGNHPLDRETQKVSRYHSLKLLSTNPPWLGTEVDSTQWSQLESHSSESCTPTESGLIIEKTIELLDSSVQLTRVKFEPRSALLSSALKGVLKDATDEVIQYDLVLTINDDFSSRIVSGNFAKLEFHFDVKDTTGCEDAISQVNTAIAGIEAKQVDKL